MQDIRNDLQYLNVIGGYDTTTPADKKSKGPSTGDGMVPFAYIILLVALAAVVTITVRRRSRQS